MGDIGHAALFRLRGEITRLTAIVDDEIAGVKPMRALSEVPTSLPTHADKRLSTAMAWTRAGSLRGKVLDLRTQDPEWNVLLDLYIAQFRGDAPSVSSSCIASGVPATTALRHIANLVAQKRIIRINDGLDRRKTYLALSADSVERMDRLMDEVISSDQRYGLERMTVAPPQRARM